jgi:transposase
LRRRNGAPATILKPDLLAKLRLRLDDPPPDGGLWSSRKVAAWMAGELNLTSVAPQRGWEALKAIGWSIQKPRPKNPKSATPEEAAAFKKSSRMPLPRRRQSTRANRSRSSPRTSIALA